ncbi:MAG: cyclopropane-fatty-acyl-phospholipid synthase family protein [Steroidobacter sp.]
MSVDARHSIIPDAALNAMRKRSLLASLGRRLLFAQLGKLQHGELIIVDDTGKHHFGQRSAEALSAVIHVDHPQLYADVAFGGSVGAGEAYIRGLWRCDDLVSLVRLFVLNRDVLNGMDSGWAWLSKPFLKLFHFWNRNSKAGSARNIAAHYDIGNELYKLMLDDTMAYSCGIFRTEHATLREASVEKFDTACRKLQLKPTDHLLEIGTGWGGMAIHAAKNYGCRVTTTTISKQQYDLAKQKVSAAGLQDRITLLLDDYRDLQGQYDKLVSIEMIEAVGANYLDTYLGKCASLLKPDGAMLLQAITLQDQFYKQALKSVDFIQRYIFPGSFIPSVNAISNSMTRVTDLKITHLEDFGPHYAITLHHWRERFLESLPEVRKLGYSDSFIRMWEYYLCYCEGGFMERQLGLAQVLFTKPGYRS